MPIVSPATPEKNTENQRPLLFANIVIPTKTLLCDALHLRRVTLRAFDVTRAPFGSLWKHAQQNLKLSTASQIKAIMCSVGWKRVKKQGQTIRFLRLKIKLGIADVAKGWIIDSVFHQLHKKV